MLHTPEGRITRVELSNYKSIKSCNVDLGPLTILVGANGAGKSNFLDALRFVADALDNSLDHALRDRGGIREVRRRSEGHPTHFRIQTQMSLPQGRTAKYHFSIATDTSGIWYVKEETCEIYPSEVFAESARFSVANGAATIRGEQHPAQASRDRLYLVTISGRPEFRDVYDRLRRMAVYSIEPEGIRNLQSPDAGDLLRRDGGNLASVIGRLSRQSPTTMSRIEEYLAHVVPGIKGVSKKEYGPKETILFDQIVGSSINPWHFDAANMSDGTLRALAILTALLQNDSGRQHVSLVGIEEPEAALHPGAAGLLLDALREATEHTQVVITSHSTELLDNRSIKPDEMICVSNYRGETRIEPLSGRALETIKRELYTPGELMRMNLLDSDDALLERQLNLFNGADAA
ncbi:MAG: AAA family ATPase [Capsulimonadaceae bacterium]|nr:AAA family ATPase [Capsulimonadaceae bacterium]